ncbi:MAG: hypothetical protein G8D28_09160 [gamma proteobacterium symbiont of Phacoides pectinatus]
MGRSALLQYLLLVATALIVFLFLHTRAEDAAVHHQRLEQLRGIRHAEGELDRNVLLASSFILAQYDGFIESRRRLRERLQRLEALIPPLTAMESEAKAVSPR